MPILSVGISIPSSCVLLDSKKVKSENLDCNKGPRGPYTQMDAARVIYLSTVLTNAPEDMIFVGMKNVEEYTKNSYVECTCFEVAVYEDSLGVRHEYYEPLDPADTRCPHENTIPHTHCKQGGACGLLLLRQR